MFYFGGSDANHANQLNSAAITIQRNWRAIETTANSITTMRSKTTEKTIFVYIYIYTKQQWNWRENMFDVILKVKKCG